MKNPHRANIAFTLVEILVVVAILALLVGLMLPVLGTMRQNALTVTATNRLKQTYVAFQNYAADNNGDLPAAGGMPDVPGEDKRNWVTRLQRYADGREFSGWQVPAQLADCFVCPVWQQTENYKTARYNTGFAMNYRLSRPDSPISSADTSTPRRQAAVAANASQKILVAPNEGWGVQFQAFSKSYKTQGFIGPKRYGNKNPKAPADQQKGFGIYLFLDGSVRQMTVDELDPFFL